MIMKVKKATREESIKYLIPVLRETARLNLPYKVTKKNIIIPIPTLIPNELR